MTPTELEIAGRSLYGELWQTPLADALGVTARTMRRWHAGSHTVPEPIRGEIALLMKATEKATQTSRKILGDEFRARVFRD